MQKMKESLEKKKILTVPRNTIWRFPVLRKEQNKMFSVGHSTEWCPDLLVSKFYISVIKAPLLA